MKRQINCTIDMLGHMLQLSLLGVIRNFPFVLSLIKKLHQIRHLIKIPLVNKWIEYIIYINKSVPSAISAYFENTESPLLCYNPNKPIRNIVFNKLDTECELWT